MSISRLFTIVAGIALLATAAFTVRAAADTSAIMNGQAALNQQRSGEQLAAGISNPVNALIDQRHGEWNASVLASDAAGLDQSDRHPNLASSNGAFALYDQRRGEWNASVPASDTAGLDQSDRHPNLASSNGALALYDQRKGEWLAGSPTSGAGLDQSDRHPTGTAQ